MCPRHGLAGNLNNSKMWENLSLSDADIFMVKVEESFHYFSEEKVASTLVILVMSSELVN